MPQRSEEPSPADIIQRARRFLRLTELACELCESPGDYAELGAHSVAIYGRSVTLVLQKLRSRVDGFDEWYAPHRQLMASDDLMRQFVELRNSLLKEGGPDLMFAQHVRVSKNDAGEVVFDNHFVGFAFRGSPPTSHLGSVLPPTGIAQQGRLYVRYLAGLVDQAEQRWSA